MDYNDIHKKCEVFDGIDSKETKNMQSGHDIGSLALYEEKPTFVGGNCSNKVETLKEEWEYLADHPR